MAKSKIKTIEENQRPKSSTYLCCFGISSSSSPSLSHKTPIEEPNIIGYDEHNNLKRKSRRRWFPWKNMFQFRVKSQSSKTVPLDQSSSSSEYDDKEKEKLKSKGKGRANNNRVQYHLSSKSNLHNKTTQSNIVQPPPTQIPFLLPPTQSQTSHKNSETNNVVKDTCQKSISSPTRPASHAVSLPTSKRQVRRLLLSSLQVQPPQTTQKQPKKHQNASKPYNSVVGASMVMVTLVIMIVWGRFCAIVCTLMCLYFVPRFRLMNGQNDVVHNDSIDDSKDLDLDSVVYKKRVVLEGLLQRNHSAVL